MSTPHIVVLTGAGMSAESGLATFRDSDGLWAKHRVEDVASIEGFYHNPQLVLDFYTMRRREAFAAKPNQGHIALAQLEQAGYQVDIITQNVDDLHERAGSSSVIHLHGELTKNCSVAHRQITHPVTPETLALKVGDLAPDGSQLRPFIVWFGEEVPMMESAARLVEVADLLVIVGTSLGVYPAASLVGYAPRTTPIILIDPKPVVSAYRHDIEHIALGASKGLEELKRRITEGGIFGR